MSYSDKDKAREHWNKSKDDANAAGQHAASAASTVGHDVRAAAGEAAQAGKYAAGRLTAPVAGAKEDINDAAHQAADKVEKEGKTTYDKLKGWFGGAKEEVKETGNEAARRADDAVHRTAGQANKGIDKTYNTRHDYHREADSARKVQEKGEGAVDSAKDAAVQAKDAVVGSMSYIGGRLTAPVSGDEGKDREIADKAKHNVNRGADKLSNAGEDTKDTAYEKKEQTKGFFSGVFGGSNGDDEANAQGKNLKDNAVDTWNSAEDKARETYNSTKDKARDTYYNAKDQVRDTYDSAKDKLQDTYDSTKAKVREAADSVEPHSNFEAIKSSGGIPSNTADILARRKSREMAELHEHETMEGMHTGTDGFLSKTAHAWGDGLEGTLGNIRAAADGGGPHATWK